MRISAVATALFRWRLTASDPAPRIPDRAWMMSIDLTRRFFLGGAVSAVVIASAPRLALSNTPVIYANGIKDDTIGLYALLRGDPVHFPSDKIELSAYKDIILHSGKYVISETVAVPKGCQVRMEAACFTASDRLLIRQPFFQAYFDDVERFFGTGVSYTIQRDGEKWRSFWVDVIDKPALSKTAASRQLRNVAPLS